MTYAAFRLKFRLEPCSRRLRDGSVASLVQILGSQEFQK